MTRDEANEYVKRRNVVELSSASSGLCVVGDCDHAAFPYGLKDHNGYVDTCAAHAADAIVDAVAFGAISPAPYRR